MEKSDYADLREAVEELHAVRVLTGDLRIREGRAKGYIARALDAAGVECVPAGRFEVRRELRQSWRFDAQALRASEPGTYERFAVADTTILYKLRELPGA